MITAASAVTLISQIIANLPAAIKAGSQVVQLVNNAYASLTEAIGDRDVTPAELDELIAAIVAKSAEIQSI